MIMLVLEKLIRDHKVFSNLIQNLIIILVLNNILRAQLDQVQLKELMLTINLNLLLDPKVQLKELPVKSKEFSKLEWKHLIILTLLINLLGQIRKTLVKEKKSWILIMADLELTVNIDQIVNLDNINLIIRIRILIQLKVFQK